MGLLCGQKTRPSGFADATPSEMAGYYKTQGADGSNTIDYQNGRGSPEREDPFEGRDPYVRPQNAAFDEKESDTLTQQNLKILDKKGGAPP